LGAGGALVTVSVIIPVRDGAAFLQRCLPAIVADEVIVVDDGSRDESAAVAERHGARVIRLVGPQGPAAARNAAAHVATGEILFFVDADVVVRPDAVAQVVAAFVAEPELAAVFGSYDDAPAARNFLSQYKNLLHHYVHQTGREDASTFWAGCGAIRREVFEAVGGFDVAQFPRPAIEDIELGYRLRRAGYRIRLRKSLQGTHLKRWTAGTLLRADFWGRAVPWTRLMLRDRQGVNDLNLRTSSRVCVGLSWLLPASVVLRWWWVAGASAVLLLTLNADVYRFFWRKRGAWFALGVIPWHWLYYFYSGLAFAVGFALHCGRRSSSASN